MLTDMIDCIRVSVFDEMPLAVFFIHNRKILYANPVAEAVFGWRPSELVGRRTRNLYKTYRDYARAGMDTIVGMRGKKSYVFDSEFLRKDRSCLTGRCHVSRMTEDPEDHRFIVFVEDMSGEKQFSSLLEEREKHYSILLDALREGIWILDRQQKTLFVNPRISDMLGYSVEEITGNTPFKFLSVGDQKKARRFISRLRKGNWHEQDLEFIRSDGKSVYANFVGSHVMDEKNRSAGFLISVRDISKRIKLEKKLVDVNRSMQALIDATPAFVMLTDVAGNIITTNKTWPKSLGRSAKGMIGENIFNLITPSLIAVRKACFRQAVESRKPVHWQDRTRFKHWGNTLYPVLDNAGNVIQMAVYSLDITERKRMEEEVLKGRQMESIGILAGGIAHDFNNLLAVVMGHLSLLKMQIPPMQKEYGHVAEAENTILLARDLTAELITFYRGGTLLKRSVNLQSFIPATVNGFQKNPMTSCTYDISESVWKIMIDRSQVSKVLHHLVCNAEEAMPGGGSIHISAANMELKSSALQLPDGHYVRLSVSDTGQGIPAENLPKIFDPYFTTKPMNNRKGVGLGLSVCYSIVRKHGGTMMAESLAGSGTTINIFFPAHEKNRGKF